MHSVSLVPYLSTSFFPPNDHAQNPGSTFCFAVVVAARQRGMFYLRLLRISSWLHVKSFITDFVMVASRVVSRQIESRQFTSH
jgi:hypothetical protein